MPEYFAYGEEKRAFLLFFINKNEFTRINCLTFYHTAVYTHTHAHARATYSYTHTFITHTHTHVYDAHNDAVVHGGALRLLVDALSFTCAARAREFSRVKRVPWGGILKKVKILSKKTH